MEIRPDPFHKEVPKPKPYKSSWQRILDKIISSVRKVFSIFSTKIFSVNRKAIKPGATKDGIHYEQMADCVKYVLAEKSIYRFSNVPDFKLTSEEKAKIRHANPEIPEDVFNAAKRICFQGKPLAMLNAKYSQTDDGKAELAVGIQMEEGIKKPLLFVFSSDRLKINSVEALLLPEMFREAFKILGITVSVPEE